MAVVTLSYDFSDAFAGVAKGVVVLGLVSDVVRGDVPYLSSFRRHS